MSFSETEIMFDHRRAVWLPGERALVIGDLHLGYAWAHRFHGQLMPLSAPEDSARRMRELCAVYSPKQLILLGDIVHEALPLEPIRAELETLQTCAAHGTELILVQGNHDRKLAPLAARLGLKLAPEFMLGRFRFIHGDKPVPHNAGVVTLMGHEHPAISLGDGVSSRKFPCFLLSRELIVLPAFSDWAAGADIRTARFMSESASRARFSKALAILGERLLPVKLG